MELPRLMSPAIPRWSKSIHRPAKATSLFTFPVPETPSALAWNSLANRFVVLSATVNDDKLSSPEITVIDPITHTTSSAAVTGLPPGQEGVGGIEYDPTQGNLLATFGPTNTFFQYRIAAIGLNAVVSQVSGTLPLPDADYLAFDPVANGMRIVDLNDDGVYALSDLFGTPVVSQLAPNLGDNQFGDPAYSDSGQLFIPRLGGNLYSLSGNSYVLVGPFGTSQDVVGLAFANIPEPSSLALLGLSCLSLIRRRREQVHLKGTHIEPL